MSIAYRADVEKYNAEGTEDFYEVQKKMFNFIKEYHDKTGESLTFKNWEDVIDRAAVAAELLEIPEDNLYFPGMTVAEIKLWYNLKKRCFSLLN